MAEAEPRRVLGDSTAVTQSLELEKVAPPGSMTQGTPPAFPVRYGPDGWDWRESGDQPDRSRRQRVS
ncbi:MAG: hypothetical protein CME15_03745 [Gemmatimonadetes bacterium]|jgi:hypothetical protein|nr:hypothetical protein [Gemmatimonadota bacterium]